MKRIVLVSLTLALFCINDLYPQARIENRNSFYEAESWILFEAYKDALPAYLKLIKSYPNNANFKYRIGQCYINTPGEKEKAVSYLEDAVKNINPDYKEGNFKEKGAPYDALYFLANAYRINNQLDKALETYRQFQKNLNSDIYDTAVVNLQIQSCLNAKELMSKPLFIKANNLGTFINEANSEFNPVVSDNEDILIYSKTEAFYDAILYSTKINGQWSGPINLNEILTVDRELFPTSISSDGKTLYLYSSLDFDGIIYTSTFTNGIWGLPVKLNDNINTKYWESHATVSHDNKKLYFTSNRKGSLGGLDIYVSKRDTAGDWGTPENLGPVINTVYNEESPFLSKDDKTLFFSSRGHFNMGGYDVFYSTLLENGQWSVPLNAGYPINSTDDDVFFKPVGQGYEGYYAIDKPQGFGKQDIYRIEIFSDQHPRKFTVKGFARIADLMSNKNDSIKISALNITDPNQILVVYSDPKTGEFTFELPHGNYKVTFEAEGGDKIVKDLSLPIDFVSDSLLMGSTILPRTDFVADLRVESNKTITVAKGDSLIIPLKVEPGSILTVEHWVGDSLLSTEKFVINDTVFTYKMMPAEGNNRIVFTLTDKFNNVTSTDVFITKEKEFTRQPLVRPEYTRIISKKQIAALTGLLKNRSSGELTSVIDEANTSKHQFGTTDDLIAYLKEEAAKKSISPEEVDMLALKVALMDNILTQAAVDLMAKYATGEMKTILEGIDINELGLKSWTDLQEYVAKKSQGRITAEDLNKLANQILSGTDPAILVLREKILTYSETSEQGNIIRDAVAAVDLQNIKVREKWLISFRTEVIKRGLTINQFAELMLAISTVPDTSAEQFLNDLISNADEPLLSFLKSIDLRKEKIKTAKELLVFLLSEKNKGKYSEEELYKTISKLITSRNLPAETIRENQAAAKETGKLWVLWIVLGVTMLFFIFYINSKKKKKKQ
ncbi:MAG: PD40 domain-containing protein [Bacteroidetes bacterium]|nr:PD40 domain-containing protein [Bacteroidota bacterium]